MLRLAFSPSYRLAGLLVLAHGLGLGAVWIVQWPLWLKSAASLLVVASCAFHLRRDALLRSPRSVVAILLKRDGRVEATRNDGATLDGRLASGSFVHPWFTTIIWRPDGARFSRAVAVLPDSAPSETFRELRVWLKWRRVDEKAGQRP